ncbi:RNA polymerase sigma factor [Kocuria sp. KH4]
MDSTAPEAPHDAAALDEDTLVARAQDGDVDAFEVLVVRYEGRLYRYAYGMVGNRQDAEDVVQDALIRAWRALPTLTTPGAFGGWLYRITSRRCLDLLQRAGSRETEPWAPEEMPDSTAPRDTVGPRPPSDPAAATETAHQMDDLTRLVHQLPPPLRACWLMREVQERPYREIAQALSISEATVRGRIARARAELAKGMMSWR